MAGFAPHFRSRANDTLEIAIHESRAILDELERVISGCTILWVPIERDIPARLKIVAIRIDEAPRCRNPIAAHARVRK